MTISYGICCFKLIDGEIHVCIVENDYTYAFHDFISCRYTTQELLDDNYMETKILSRMTMYEKKLIMLFNVEILLLLTWNIGRNNYSSILPDQEDTLTMFKNHIFHDKERLIRLINNSNYHYSEVEIYKQTMSLPKGRKKKHGKDDDIKTAMREFEEETGIKKYNILDRLPYKYNLDRNYDIILFLAEVTNNMPFGFDHANHDQFTEVKNIKWWSEYEIKKRLPFMYTNIKPLVEQYKALKKLNEKKLIDG